MDWHCPWGMCMRRDNAAQSILGLHMSVWRPRWPHEPSDLRRPSPKIKWPQMDHALTSPLGLQQLRYHAPQTKVGDLSPTVPSSCSQTRALDPDNWRCPPPRLPVYSLNRTYSFCALFTASCAPFFFDYCSSRRSIAALLLPDFTQQTATTVHPATQATTVPPRIPATSDGKAPQLPTFYVLPNTIDTLRTLNPGSERIHHVVQSQGPVRVLLASRG